MGDAKAALNVCYLIIMSMVLMMGIDYLGVVSPEMLGKSFIMDFLAPLSFQYATEIIWAFLFASIVTFMISPASDMVGDTIARSQARKVVISIVFVLSTLFLAFVHNMPFMFFAVAYPLVFIAFNITGFIVSNLLKTKKNLLNRKFGFDRVNVLIESPTSFNLYGEKDGYLNIENPFRGISILGGAGSGKTYTIVEPIIEAAIKKGFTGLIYDFKMNANFSKNKKYWALTRYAYKCFIYFGSKPAQKDVNGNWVGDQGIQNDRRKLWVINFRDVRYSHRVNPIHPRYMETQAFANEYSLTLMQNLKPEWIKNRDFFADSAIIYLKAIFWFLKSQFPESCTLPHAVTIALMPHSKVLAMLSLDDQCYEIISSLLVAEQKNAEGQIAGAVASLQVPIDKLNSPEIFWVLSESDFSLSLNDPNEPGFLCLGNDPELKQTYGPVAALIATVVKKVMNRPGMLPSIYLLDECPTLAIPDLSELPATARSNEVASILIAQDRSQYLINYGKEQTDALLANCGNQLYLQLNDLDTAKMVSELIGTREKENISVNSGKNMGDSLSKSTGENIGIQRESLIQPYEMKSLQKGRIVGAVAEVSERKPYSYFFNVRPDVQKIDFEHDFPTLLKLDDKGTELSTTDVNELMLKNYEKIKKEAFKLVDHCARAACLGGKADETKVFPQHFYKGKRIVSIFGDPMVEGIQVDKETGIVSGTPVIEEKAPMAGMG